LRLMDGFEIVLDGTRRQHNPLTRSDKPPLAALKVMPDHSTGPVTARSAASRGERLTDALSTPDRKARYVARLFATIADRYDLITRLLSYGRDQQWKRRLIVTAAIAPGERVLDLACGTGDLAFEASARGATVIGLDLTPRMVHLALERARASAHPGAPANSGAAAFTVGDMMSLPVPDASFDVVTTGYGLRNVPVLDDAIREIHRVLKPGGRLLSLDFNRPSSAPLRAAYLAYLTVVGSTVGWALHGDPDTYRYIPESIKRYPGAEAVVQRLRASGFSEARWEPVLGGLMAIHVARK
jgi:ubiquinone/menaquinone biosynthesis methyltransferase